jgi:uncharacterized protein (TIGR00251 family)
VQPGASRPGIAGIHGDALKVRVTAPPADGRANRELIEYLAEVLGVTRGCVTLVKGDTSRRKTIVVQGVSLRDAARLLGVEPAP